MKTTYDAVVFGTGIAGLGTAIGLARRKKKVLVIGRRGIRGEASAAAAGILDPLLEVGPRSPLFRLNGQAFRRYPALLREIKKRTGLDPGYSRTGLLYLAKTREEERELKRRFYWQKKSGIPIRWLSREEVIKKETGVSRKVRAGLYYPTIGRVQPKRWMAALERYARSLGVEIKRCEGPAPTLTLPLQDEGGGKGRGGLAPFVVNATGSWAGRSIIPARGQILIAKGRKPQSKTILHSLTGGYIVPWGEGKYLIGSTVEFVGFKPDVTARGLKSIWQKAEKLLPGARRWKRLDAWAGLRPYSKDRLPLVGPTTVPGLYLCTGFYRSGILLGPHVGDLLAEGMVSGQMPKILRPLDPRRVERKHGR